MCGIAGFWEFKSTRTRNAQHDILKKMNDAIANRGPDGEGYFLHESGIGLGHRRLAILDLSELGAQPMHSSSKRYTIVFNGEVYNAPRLAPALVQRGYTFKGTSDTEIMLAAIEAYGLEMAIGQFIGMFAFALFDHKEQLLHLVRDRLGVKPLYFGIEKNTLLFSSQPKSFYAHPDFSGRVNKGTLGTYLSYNYIPSSSCIFENIEKVQPGEIVTVHKDKSIHKKTYWSLENVNQEGIRNPLHFKNDAEAIDTLEHLLEDATRLRMLSDVPLGAFLSGGIDSSAIVALMQKNSTTPVKTFSIGFESKDFDEAIYARDVAKHLGTDHTECYMNEKDALSIIPKLPQFFDEPFADSSQIPTYLVSALAKKHVTVALSGDGGDEFFAGYTRYRVCEKFWNIYKFAPKPVRKILSHMIQFAPEKSWDRFAKMLPLGPLKKGFGEKLYRFKNIIDADHEGELFQSILQLWNTGDLESMLHHKDTHFKDTWNRFKTKNFTTHMQLFDAACYLPDDILTKVDRASMGVSLEARGPLLDHRIAEWAFRLPMHYKVRGGTSKWILRQVLERHVPKSLFDRPKQGFGVPLESWLAGPLRPWAEDLLSPQKLKNYGIENPAPILMRFDEMKEKKRNWSYSLWGVLMYQAWCEEYKISI